LSGPIVADFHADVELSNWTEGESSQARIVLTDEKMGVAIDGAKRTIGLSNVFDIVQGISPQWAAGSTETITLAFRANGRRETISVSTGVETLVKFQRVLYKQLLNGTSVVATYRSRIGGEKSEPCEYELAVTGSRISLRLEEADDQITIRRDDITQFKTPSSSPANEEPKPVVVIYSDTGDQVAKTTVSMPSFRILNLFGRYLRTDLLSTDEIKTTSERKNTIEILLVDDDSHDLEMAEVFLKEQSNRFSITSVLSASEALDILDQRDGDTGSFDCVVSDYRMPGIDGLEFLSKIRDDYPELPFILYTGQGSKKVVKQAILDDVTDYVEKDVGREQYEVLAERIQKAVR
jgi:CheY-like chemotaxis protein